jgi:hypothetical protein
MKKIISTSAMLLISILSFSQAFIGIATTNKGFGLHAGVLAESVEIKASYQHPYHHQAAIASFTIGNQFLLTHDEKDNYSVTPSIGYARHSREDLSDYKNGGEKITQVVEFHPIFGLEAGKDCFLGRYFVTANYSKGAYFGAGIRAYLRYNKLKGY